MRVGVFIPGYTPDAGGGYTFENDILENLAKLALHCKHTFTVFTPHPSKSLTQFLELFPQIKLIATENGATLRVRIIRKINKLIDRNKQYLGDLNQAAHNANIDMIWFVSPAYQPVDIPYIATIWDLQHRLQPWFPEVGSQQEWLFREGFYSQMIQRAAFVITGTKTGRDEISLFYQIPKDRIRLLPHPTPSLLQDMIKRDDTHDPLEKYHLPSFFLFYPAQFWPHKNHLNLLWALVVLRKKYNIIMNLVLVGSEKGNEVYVQDQIKTLGLENQVRVLGFVSREELLALYRKALALAYVTFFGPENLPPLEAFSLGCPVIASAVRGAEEQLGDAAILVNPEDPEDIARAVKDLLENSLIRNELIERGQKRASQWAGGDFVRGVFNILDEFEVIRRSWR